MGFEDIGDLDQTEADIAQTQKNYADEVAKVWYPFGKLCCKFLTYEREIFGKSIYSKKVKLTDNVVFYSTSIIKNDYLFEFYYHKGAFKEPKLMLRVNISTTGGFSSRPTGYGFLYYGTSANPGSYFVNDSVFYYDEVYKEYILEAYQIMKQWIQEALSKKQTQVDSSKAFGSLTFAEAISQIEKALHHLEEKLK